MIEYFVYHFILMTRIRTRTEPAEALICFIAIQQSRAMILPILLVSSYSCHDYWFILGKLKL